MTSKKINLFYFSFVYSKKLREGIVFFFFSNVDSFQKLKSSTKCSFVCKQVNKNVYSSF
jgi:hypothetical protein